MIKPVHEAAEDINFVQNADEKGTYTWINVAGFMRDSSITCSKMSHFLLQGRISTNLPPTCAKVNNRLRETSFDQNKAESNKSIANNLVVQQEAMVF